MAQRELVELARRGDREAFSALAASVVDRLYATAVLILRDHSMADDATQETTSGPGVTCRHCGIRIASTPGCGACW